MQYHYLVMSLFSVSEPALWKYHGVRIFLLNLAQISRKIREEQQNRSQEINCMKLTSRILLNFSSTFPCHIYNQCIKFVSCVKINVYFSTRFCLKLWLASWRHSSTLRKCYHKYNEELKEK